MDREVALLQLSRRYEDRLFQQAQSANAAVPAVVITGFLGSGKTTLVQHLLRLG
jgi:tRNA A37 threonylcarbamoyladenosine biosynthesis protein TsaE